MEVIARVFDRRGEVLVEGTGYPLEAIKDACRMVGGTPRSKRAVRQRGGRRGRNPLEIHVQPKE